MFGSCVKNIVYYRNWEEEQVKYVAKLHATTKLFAIQSMTIILLLLSLIVLSVVFEEIINLVNSDKLTKDGKAQLVYQGQMSI